jgi:hypothetical protein
MSISEMEELEEQYRRKTSSFWSLLLTVGVASFAATALENIWNVPYFATFAFFFWLGFLVEYWIPPRPPTSFLVWVVKTSIFAVAFAFCLWIIPNFLANYIWKPLAYGLPVFAFFTGSYWLMPLYPTRKKATLKDMMLIGLIFAVVYGTIMFFIG